MKFAAHCTAFFLCASQPVMADPGYPGDDSHNHDGSHPESIRNCGTNYMLPGVIARLGSHSFMILGKDGPSHVLAEHRSGTPPHNYQFVFRVRLDPGEVKAYEELLIDAKTLPAFTTIWFDETGKQLDRTFWCLQDLEKIFGKEKKKDDEHEKLFPIRASLQKDPDHEGSFDIEKSVARGKFLTLSRGDFELVFSRYLPAYLPQPALRKAIRDKGEQLKKLFAHQPLTHNEPEATASGRRGYMSKDGLQGSGRANCPPNFYLKKSPMPEAVHAFVLLAEDGQGSVLATHYYDQSPQNFQTLLRLKLGDQALRIYREARKGGIPPLLRTNEAFCMETIREQLKQGKLALSGTIYRDPDLHDYQPGKPAGTIQLKSTDIEVLVNRRLESLLNLEAVVKDVQSAGAKAKPDSPAKDY